MVELWYDKLDDPAIEKELASMLEEEKQLLRSDIWKTIGNQLPPKVKSEVSPGETPVHANWSKGQLGTPIFLKIAACFLLVIASLAGARYWYQQPGAPIAVNQGEQQWQEVISPKGQKAIVTLADGSRVYLNAESKLIYPTAFVAERREVVLEGEAFFEVKKDPKKPFSVQSGELMTIVLGTSFNVKAYRESKYTQVVVLSGRVTVKRLKQETAPEKNLLLRPNEQLTYDNASREIKKEVVVASQVAGWKNGILLLQNASFEESVRVLERWYGVKIMFETERLRHRKVAASFERATLKHVLKTLSLGLNFSYVVQGDTVRIK